MNQPADNSSRHASLGGIIHTYQAFDPKSFPPPTAPPPDLVSGAFEHMLAYGSTRALTDEELARAIRLDPSQIKGLGPSLDALIAILEERSPGNVTTDKRISRHKPRVMFHDRVFHDCHTA